MFAILTKNDYQIINKEEIDILEEINVLLMPFDDVVEGLLTLSFISLSFYIPVFTVLKNKVSSSVVQHTIAMKQELLKHLTIDEWDLNLVVSTALDPRFHKRIFTEYPMEKVKQYLDSLGNSSLFSY